MFFWLQDQYSTLDKYRAQSELFKHQFFFEKCSTVAASMRTISKGSRRAIWPTLMDSLWVLIPPLKPRSICAQSSGALCATVFWCLVVTPVNAAGPVSLLWKLHASSLLCIAILWLLKSDADSRNGGSFILGRGGNVVQIHCRNNMTEQYNLKSQRLKQ